MWKKDNSKNSKNVYFKRLNYSFGYNVEIRVFSLMDYLFIISLKKYPGSVACRASVAQRQCLGLGAEKSLVRNSLEPFGFSLRQGN